MEQIKVRRSIRKYLNKPVEDEKIIQLLESARLAPSGSNTQPWHFIIVKSELTKQKLAKVAHDQKWMISAPIFIVCVADLSSIMENDQIILDEHSPQGEVKRMIRDTAIATEHILLEATHLGLGTCWVAWFTQEEIRPTLHIPLNKYVVGIVTIGYAAEMPTARPRKTLEEMIHYENW